MSIDSNVIRGILRILSVEPCTVGISKRIQAISEEAL
jgi:hypothetical protein